MLFAVVFSLAILVSGESLQIGLRGTERGLRLRAVENRGFEVKEEGEKIIQKGWQCKQGPESTVIVGGGPCGLGTALALAQKGWKNIKVIDARAEPPPCDEPYKDWYNTGRFYLLGIGGRGQRAMRKLGIWDSVQLYSTKVLGRKDWSPGSTEGEERIYVNRPADTHVLARDRLVGVFYRVLKENYNIEFMWNTSCTDISFHTKNSTVHIVTGGTLTSTLSADLIIGADGAVRQVANAAGVQVYRYEDDNPRVYKALKMNIPKSWRPDLNYGARTKSGLNFDALPATREGEYCGVLLFEKGHPEAKANASALVLRSLLNEHLPQFSPYIDDDALSTAAKAAPGNLPSFRFIDDSLTPYGDRLVLLGDAAHTVKPYFGLGVQTGLEDVVALSDALANYTYGHDALQSFDTMRRPQAKALVELSRGLDRPGFLGFVTFVLPLLLDALCNKLAPRIFSTNTIAMMQRIDLDFTRVQQIKRRDRLLQFFLLTSVFSLLATGLRHFFTASLSTKFSILGAGLAVGIGIFSGGSLFRRLSPRLLSVKEGKKDAAASRPSPL